MKHFSRFTLLLAFGGLLQQCSYSQNKPATAVQNLSDSTPNKQSMKKENNPAYSTTDTSQVAKFDSGCGWPSFYEPISKTSIIYTPDKTHGMERTETQCGRCKAHLGHVFDDGPPPTGLRYCINGVVLDFQKAQEAEKQYNEKKGQ